MNEQERLLPADARTALEKCFSQIRLARATELAQSRRFLEAEAVLVQNGEFPDDPRELDLLARIAALQGRFDDARRCWNAAMQKDPENETYRECVELLTTPRRIIRLITNSQDTMVIIVAWLMVAFAIGAIVFTFHFE